jgi:ferredoxin
LKLTSNVNFLAKAGLQTLIDNLVSLGYECFGPQVRDHAIVYDVITNIADLPVGIIDVQSPGHYRLKQTGDKNFFRWNNGPQGIKPLVFKPEEPIWSCQKSPDGNLRFEKNMISVKKRAVIGVRACDIAALFLQDKHFLHDHNKDEYYRNRRQDLLLIAANCTRSAATCFCSSTGDGPRAHYGYDISLTELADGLLVHTLSEQGDNVIKELELRTATQEEMAEADSLINVAAEQQRSLPSHNLKAMLFSKLKDARWQQIADRCLSCGNCTSVCPTCFCHSENEKPAMNGEVSQHTRQWDSCFSQEHSYIHGITIRSETQHRYRQWLTHKFGSWHDQYGRSGCVGCGRCISWCPVGIDVTEELNAFADGA